VAWRELGANVETARVDEIEPLASFGALHDGRRPLANLSG
jgi:hypothetical protein